MIHFVGAGPGATDLITVRGAKLIKEADIIIYAGSLVNPELLKMSKTNCKIYNSAKMTLDDVTEIFANPATRNLNIVRLHTGDPSIYGAIREQMDFLRANEINFDITPGVSSFCAAAAAAEVEYTLPDISQSLIITRMEGRTPVPPMEKLELMAKHQTSMVLFLSAGLLEETCKALITGGYSSETPAVMVYKASWPEERVFRGTVGTIPKIAERENIRNTALILVGNFLGNEYSFSKLYDKNFSHMFRDSEGK